MWGSSTGGLLVILLGRLGLDCPTAIQEYKTLAQKLFGDDRKAYMDKLTTEKAQLDPKAYEDALADLVFRCGEDKDLPFFLPNETPGKNTQVSTICRVFCRK
jgi:hypothetical protein